MAMEKFEVDKEQSEFNMSVAMLIRVDKLFTAIAIASNNKQLGVWYNNLLTLVREIKYDWKPEEEGLNNEFREKINPLINEYENRLRSNNLHLFKDFGKLYLLLEEYETFIKKGFNERNWLMKIKELDMGI